MILFSVLWLVSCTEDLQLRRGRVENDEKTGQGYYHTLLHCKFSTAPQTFSLVFSHEGHVADDGYTNQTDGRFCEHLKASNLKNFPLLEVQSSRLKAT